MIDILKKIRWQQQIRSKVGNPHLSNLLIENGIIADRIKGEGRSLRFLRPSSGIEINLETESFILEAHSNLKALEELGGRLFRAPGGELRFSIDGITLSPSSSEEILIAAEVFREGVYNLSFTRSTTVIDIGANVGTSSLFFSNRPNVVRVIAFEPLPDNIIQANLNFSLNPNLSDKIRIFPCALGNSNRHQDMTFDRNLRGSASLIHDPEFIGRLAGVASNKTTVKVEVKCASEILSREINQESDNDIWIKMDCEGGENEILPNLIDTGLIRRVKGLAIETHQGCGPLQEKMLLDAGFTVWRSNPYSRDLGYILAFSSGS